MNAQKKGVDKIRFCHFSSRLHTSGLKFISDQRSAFGAGAFATVYGTRMSGPWADDLRQQLNSINFCKQPHHRHLGRVF
jgi:hypothetical protein